MDAGYGPSLNKTYLILDREWMNVVCKIKLVDQLNEILIQAKNVFKWEQQQQQQHKMPFYGNENGEWSKWI